jgi:2'-5' RNA ligase
MSVIVALYFDEKTEKKIFSIWQKLATERLTSFLLDIGIRPHITLTDFEQAEIKRLSDATRAFAGNAKSFEVNLCSVGSFPVTGKPIYYSPVPTKRLLDIHSEYYNFIKPIGLNWGNYYLPENWVPHCTVAEKVIDENAFKQTFWYCCNAGIPITGKIASIGIFEFMPVKEIVCFDLN